MIKYVKCPRCDLNYINEELQEYCDVCLAEIKGTKLQFADLDEDLLGEDEVDEDAIELCPICGINRMHIGEKMCESCRQSPMNSFEDEEDEIDPENDEEWKNYLDDDTSEDLTVDDAELAEELDIEDEEIEVCEDDDDFDDDFDDLSDEDYDDDDDDFDDDDDEF